jgi:acetyl esterase/lipase
MSNPVCACWLVLAVFCCAQLNASEKASAAEKVVRLYEGPAPGSENWKQEEKELHSEIIQTRVVYNVVTPTLTVVEPDPSVAVGTAVIICPGGGFHFLSMDVEGLDVASTLAKQGITCFVLKYRLVECKSSDPFVELMQHMGADFEKFIAPTHQLATADGLAAIDHVRKNSAEYKVNPQRIGIIGFSAGGMVAASVAYHYSEETRPNFVAPIYLGWKKTPGVDVPRDAPPMFILAATDDQLGLAPDSVALYQDWTAAKKSAELHLYAKGGHGFGMRTQNLPSDKWINLFSDWMASEGFMKR